jgi:oligoribonuclease NrnB/cAMP/cGMP phosphodiesterase (DHH superfamily)
MPAGFGVPSGAPVSLKPEDMRRLAEISDLTWIDHHKTAIEGARDLGLTIRGRREVGKAACELAWEHYFPERKMSPMVRALGRYDVWDHSHPHTLPVQYGARLHLPNVEKSVSLWDEVLSVKCTRLFDQCVRDGRLVLKYQAAQNEAVAKAQAFETELAGLRAIACNRGLANSQLFDSVWDPQRHDMMLVFWLTGNGQWKVSLYSTKPDVDCGVVAQRFGGGGHAGAAGFHCRVLPFAWANSD